MPPQGAPAPTQVPQGQVNPMMMALLRARAAGGGAPGPMPNGLPTPGAPGAPPNPAAAGMARPGAASPTQQVTKAGMQAQSPLLDPETRGIAKQLVQKLLQHM
jgi:hypothetical protein